ncbi:MAG: hypothetical protein KA149_10535 [Chitinophagales bacterium]|jgi:hypothetical protein|nr:hypothetical protein [Chitinophagales bacterium]
MKGCLFLLFLLFQRDSFSQQLTRQQMRDLFLSATERKSALDSLMNKLEFIEKRTPAEESYLGICNGYYCQHVDGNWAKLKYVMKAKNHLNSAVERDAKDPELRFMRLMLEHFLPSFLGLNKHIDEDLKVIFANSGFIDDNPPVKKKALDFLLWSKRCTPEQEKRLLAELNELNKKLSPLQAKKGG